MPEGAPVQIGGFTKLADVPCEACVEDDPVTPPCGPCQGTGRVASLDFRFEQRTAACPRCGGLGFRISGVAANALDAVRAARRAGEA